MPPLIDGTASFYGEPEPALSSTRFRVGVLLAVMWLELLAGWLGDVVNARLRNAISRTADWVNGLAVKLFDLAGRIRGKAGE